MSGAEGHGGEAPGEQESRALTMLYADLQSQIDAFETGIRLARTDGVMAGPTTGASLAAALKMGIPRGRAVVIACDSAAKYLSDYAAYLND